MNGDFIMPKVFSNVSQVESVNKKIMQYIREKKPMPKNTNLTHVWAQDSQTHIPERRYAGQIKYTKLLANGNTQDRLVTAYGDGSIGMTTVVKSPTGELLKAYSGVRGKSWEAINPTTNEVVSKNAGTIAYCSGNKQDVLNNLRNGNIFGGNPQADRNNLYLLV